MCVYLVAVVKVPQEVNLPPGVIVVEDNDFKCVQNKMYNFDSV